LAGLRIDNCFVEVDAAEMPGCDGSSQAFVDALEKAGSETQPSPRAVLVVTEIMRLGNEETWIEARPAIRNEMSVKYRIDYGSQTSIGRQMYQGTVTAESFRRDLAPCRTFLLQEEAQWLREQGLGSRATTADLLIFDHDGPIDNELKFGNECARHKALDLVGDLALLGCDLVGQFTCHCGGHRLHAELARALAREGRVIRERRLTA
jgi:UDP-3-O-[3-hydroxymyristoyl] N-acetylglucosamine deacetylase